MAIKHSSPKTIVNFFSLYKDGSNPKSLAQLLWQLEEILVYIWYCIWNFIWTHLFCSAYLHKNNNKLGFFWVFLRHFPLFGILILKITSVALPGHACESSYLGNNICLEGTEKLKNTSAWCLKKAILPDKMLTKVATNLSLLQEHSIEFTLLREG